MSSMSILSIETATSELCKRWPARSKQIGQLLRLIGSPGQAGMDIFAYGAPKSGKTTMVRSCLSQLGRLHAYCELGDTIKPKQLFSSLLSQLHALKRKREAGYNGVTADSTADFVNELARCCPAQQPTAYIVLDGAQLLARSQLLAAMMAAREITGANVAYILVSSVPWSSHWFFEGLARGVMPQVYFPAYTEQEIATILVQELQARIRSSSPTTLSAHDSHAALVQRHLSLAGPFVSGVVCPHFMPVTRSLSDLKAVSGYLWGAYVQPTLNGQPEYAPHQPLELLARRLLAAVKERLLLTLDVLQPGMSHTSLIDVAVKRLRGMSASSAKQGGDQSHAAQYEQEWGSLPGTAKLLIVSAFIASHNKASQDKAVFDAGTKSGRVRGSRATQESDRQTEAAKEAKLKGPSPFSLNRLLNIYHCLHMAADHCGAQTAAAQRVQGLHALKPSFVITSATLMAMDKCDTLYAGDREKNEQSQVTAQMPSQPLQSGLLGQQMPLQSVHEEEEDDVEGEDFQRALAQVQKRGGRGGRGGRGRGGNARTKAKKGGELELAAPLPAPAYGAIAPGGLRLDAATAHVPHPASGVARQGLLPMSSDAAPLLNNIATLTDMGLLKKAAAEDLLEAPRLVVGCVDEHLAAALARDCGLKLASYLKYA